MQETLDVVIPSYRLDEEVLINIFSLKKPDNFDIKYYLVADNPSITISQNLKRVINRNDITLLINEINLGFSKTRNQGIDAGNGNWILLLDDDILPNPNLLIAYGNAINYNKDSIGFVGVTKFPTPFNNVTEALLLNGVVGHFQSAAHAPDLSWAPTANILLSRKHLGTRRFLPELINGGEDIELLFRNSKENNKKYITVPDAVVTHPWWNNGKIQSKRMFRYGLGISDIIDQPILKKYSSLDFFNTTESVVVLIIAFLTTLVLGKAKIIFLGILFVVLGAEIITNIIRSKVYSGRFSISLALQMLWHKNCNEAGFVWGLIKSGKISYFGRRLDVSFRKINPSPFRLNKWKIIKLSLIVISLLCLIQNFIKFGGIH